MTTTGPSVTDLMSGDETTRHVLSDGMLVLLLYASANRDEAVFAEPHPHSPGQRHNCRDEPAGEWGRPCRTTMAS